MDEELGTFFIGTIWGCSIGLLIMSFIIMIITRCGVL